MPRFFILCFISVITFDANAQYNLRRVASFPSQLNEISGIQYLKGDFWVLNDGGNPANLYQVDTFGNILKTYAVRGKNIDWEELATDGDSLLFIGDFGNNHNQRKDLGIYAININKAINDTFTPRFIPFSYSDQVNFPPPNNKLHFDCESFVFLKDTFYLFSKNRTSPYDGWVKRYTLANNAKDTVAMLNDSLQIGGFLKELFWITAADIDLKKNEMALLSSDKVYLFTQPGTNASLQGIQKTINLGDISQKEGLCYDKEGVLWIVDEAYSGPAGLYKLEHTKATIRPEKLLPLKIHFNRNLRALILFDLTHTGRISIYDALGNLVYQAGNTIIGDVEINAAHWEAGHYFIYYHTATENYREKFKIY